MLILTAAPHSCAGGDPHSLPTFRRRNDRRAGGPFLARSARTFPAVTFFVTGAVLRAFPRPPRPRRPRESRLSLALQQGHGSCIGQPAVNQRDQDGFTLVEMLVVVAIV